MTNVNAEELEGTTLNVYAYVVKEGKSVGPREVMRATNLTSPSIAHWHLQKLEALGLLAKTEYGEYTVKEKVNVSGHLWVRQNVGASAHLLLFLFFGHSNSGNRSSYFTFNYAGRLSQFVLLLFDFADCHSRNSVFG